MTCNTREENAAEMAAEESMPKYRATRYLCHPEAEHLDPFRAPNDERAQIEVVAGEDMGTNDWDYCEDSDHGFCQCETVYELERYDPAKRKWEKAGEVFRDGDRPYIADARAFVRKVAAMLPAHERDASKGDPIMNVCCDYNVLIAEARRICGTPEPTI